MRISDWSSDVCSSDLFVEAVSEAADCGDDIGPKLLPYAGDENLDRVRITVEILIVDMLDQFGAGNHLALVVKQIAEQLVFLGVQLHRLAVQRHAAGTGVEPHRPCGQDRKSVGTGKSVSGPVYPGGLD